MNEEPRYCTEDGRYVAQYCSPVDVARAIRMIDFNDPNLKIWEPSDASVPTYDELIFRICAKEDELDRYVGTTWRCNRVVDHVTSMNTYWHDINALRSDYWLRGGYAVQLNQDIREWDPSKGDRLYLRTMNNTWRDVSDMFVAPCDREGRTEQIGWIDYEQGVLYVQSRYLTPKFNSVKVTYRYGKAEPVPPAISRCCALMVALTLLNEDLYLTRLGQGGDLGGQKNDMKKAMQDEINSIIMLYRRFTPVYSLYE